MTIILRGKENLRLENTLEVKISNVNPMLLHDFVDHLSNLKSAYEDVKERGDDIIVSCRTDTEVMFIANKWLDFKQENV